MERERGKEKKIEKLLDMYRETACMSSTLGNVLLMCIGHAFTNSIFQAIDAAFTNSIHHPFRR